MKDFQHALSLLVLTGKLGIAPVQSPKHVLDIATGTGIWAMEYGKLFKTTLCRATLNSFYSGAEPIINGRGDRSERHPALPKVLNCSFVREDSETQEWIFPNKFDYVHLRYVVSCFNDTRTVIQKAFDHMNPGGWIEFYDAGMEAKCIDGTLTGTHLERWTQLVMAGGAKLGRDLGKAKNYKTWLAAAGFVDVVEKVIPAPGNTWPKDPRFKQIGLYTLHDTLDLIGSVHKFLMTAGLSAQEADELVPKVKEDMQNTAIHFFWPM